MLLKPPLRRRGQGAAEFALLLPLLAILLAGVIDVGRGFHARVILTNAVREGARYAASNPTDDSAIRTVVHSELCETSVRGITDDEITITKPDPIAAEQPITVRARFSFTPLMGAMLGIGAIPIDVTARMMIL